MFRFLDYLGPRFLVVVAGAALVGLGVVLGCSPESRERAKHFFFEVPDETQAKAASPEGDPQRPDRPTLAPPAAKFASVHPPYAQHKCTSCHDSTQQMQVRSDLPEACRGCQRRYFSEEVGHSPVADGDCLICHQLHRSTLASLLLQPIPDTCIDCHDEPEDLSEEAHGVDNAADCIGCHDPHFGTGVLLRGVS